MVIEIEMDVLRHSLLTGLYRNFKRIDSRHGFPQEKYGFKPAVWSVSSKMAPTLGTAVLNEV